MREQEKKRQRIYDLLNAETFLCLPHTKQRKEFIEKEILKVKGEWRTERKRKKKLFYFSCLGD